jgi:hypothetical protein
MVISATFLSAVSEIAIVPDSECRMPTLMVSAACAPAGRPIAAMEAESVRALTKLRRFMDGPLAVGGSRAQRRLRR